MIEQRAEERTLAKAERRARKTWSSLLYRCYNRVMVRCKNRGHTLQLGLEGSKLFCLVGMISCCTRIKRKIPPRDIILTVAK